MKTANEIALLYLSNHFREGIKLADIAEHVGLSKYHFHRLFVEENKITPQAYLEKLRMEHASHFMILFPTSSFAEVAFESGYSSPSCFSRAFKKQYSISPTKYRAEKKIPGSPNLSEDHNNQSIPVKYIASKTIEVQKVQLSTKELNNKYQSIIDNAHPPIETIGFYLDVPFHVPLNDCRYYVGIDKKTNNRINNTLCMPGGFYTSIIVKGDFDILKEKLYQLRSRIESCGYVIDSLVGYEKLLLPEKATKFNYFEAQREVFIKIKRI